MAARSEPDALLELRRSGGFGGLTLRATAGREEVSDGELAALRRLFVSPPRPASPGGPDRFQYDLALLEGGERRETSLGEEEVPAELRALVERLARRAVPV
jgi:hypothetical protein